jgi:DUF1016 N-terminal domain
MRLLERRRRRFTNAQHSIDKSRADEYMLSIEFEQQGSERAEYGTALINNLSKDLKIRHGKGFRSNLYVMRLFYQKYPKFQTSGIFQTSGKSSKSLP